MSSANSFNPLFRSVKFFSFGPLQFGETFLNFGGLRFAGNFEVNINVSA